MKKNDFGLTGTAFWIAVYMLCSSMLLLVNKLAIYFLKVPSFILFCQLAASAVFVKGAAIGGFVAVDDMSWNHLKPFSIVAAAFLATIFANIKTLQYANVETFIVFRACTPLALCVLDYIFLGRQLPNGRSIVCLLALALGAYGYVINDKTFEIKGYMWVGIWFVVFLFDMIFLKHATNTVKVKSNWTRVFYSNFLPCFPLVAMGLYSQEKPEWSTRGTIILLLSCVMGLMMSYVSWMARSLISATAFSIVGNVCKFITIFVNFLIWENHASTKSIACLSVCLVAAFFYQQAPLRDSECSAQSIDNQKQSGIELTQTAKEGETEKV